MKKFIEMKTSEKQLFRKIPTLLGIFLFITLLLSSCDSHDSSSDGEFSATILDTASEITEIDDTSENINEIIESAYLEVATSDFFKSSEYKNQQDKRFLSDCVAVSKEFMDDYIEIILDYGEGCTTKKGHEAKGKIIIHVDLSLENAVVNMSYTFDEFYINNKKIEGNVQKKRSRTNENGNPQSQINREIKIIWEDASYSTIKGERIREWTDGKENDIWGDNIFSITGSWVITKRDGTLITDTITVPLVRKLACRFIVSGVVEIISNDKTNILDYGNDECDDLATITKEDGASYEIHINRKKWK